MAPPQPGEAGRDSPTPVTDEVTEAPGQGAALSGSNGGLAGEKECQDREGENMGPLPRDLQAGPLPAPRFSRLPWCEPPCFSPELEEHTQPRSPHNITPLAFLKTWHKNIPPENT